MKQLLQQIKAAHDSDGLSPILTALLVATGFIVGWIVTTPGSF